MTCEAEENGVHRKLPTQRWICGIKFTLPDSLKRHVRDSPQVSAEKLASKFPQQPHTPWKKPAKHTEILSIEEPAAPFPKPPDMPQKKAIQAP